MSPCRLTNSPCSAAWKRMQLIFESAAISLSSPRFGDAVVIVTTDIHYQVAGFMVHIKCRKDDVYIVNKLYVHVYCIQYIICRWCQNVYRSWGLLGIQTSKLIENSVIKQCNRSSDSFIHCWGWSRRRTALEDASKASLQSLDQQMSDLRRVMFGMDPNTVHFFGVCLEGSFESEKVSNLIWKKSSIWKLNYWIIVNDIFIWLEGIRQKLSKAKDQSLPRTCCFHVFIVFYFYASLWFPGVPIQQDSTASKLSCALYTRTWPCIVIRSPQTQPQGSSKAVHTVEGPLWAIGSMCRWQNMLHAQWSMTLWHCDIHWPFWT